MEQYLQLLKTIKQRGTHKPAARENMPGTTSLFGYQFRHDLSHGFPLLTTKEMFWKGIVVELIWFLRGDTNIKYLVDNGANFWNEDAYNYYIKVMEKKNVDYRIPFKAFIELIKKGDLRWKKDMIGEDYKLGDCGFQYGKVWRAWENPLVGHSLGRAIIKDNVDQIANVIKSLKTNPEGRRHIVTAVDPAHDDQLALYWCHSMFQFNCRPIDHFDRLGLAEVDENTGNVAVSTAPRYYLDCQLYQRSADVFLGVPFNIASYALLTHIFCKILNMVPGDFIHTFGDVHIYDNHILAVNKQLERQPGVLPILEFSDWFNNSVVEGQPFSNLDEWINSISPSDFSIADYNPQPPIKATLSTGLIK